MRDFIRRKLNEAIKSSHWVKDSYPERILDSTIKNLNYETKQTIDDNIKKLESLEFGNEGDRIGVWLFQSPIEIKHPPFKDRDKGTLLLAIVNNNNMTTLYWKHKKEGEYDLSITINKLIEFSKSDFYHPIKKPITIKRLLAWSKSFNEPKNSRESFKQINLTNNTKVKYFKDSNEFKTINNEPLEVTNVFNYLPNDNIIIDVFSNSNDDEKMKLIDLLPSHLYNQAEELF